MQPSVRLSIVIPSYKDPLLHRTVADLLKHSELGDRLELVICLDGYWTADPIVCDDRVKIVHHGHNRGMRQAINSAISVSRGEFIMRTDEHCRFCPGYDRILVESCEDNWIMTGVQYFLDPVHWRRMNLEPVLHQKLVIQGGVKFAGQRWRERDEQQKDVPISETMAMQGSVWVMKRSWWDSVIGELQTEGYGPLVQDSHELSFLTWQAGGKLMLNKAMWFAHKHRSFPRTHQNGTKENPANCEQAYAYALSVWRDYYEQEIRPKWGI